MELISETEQRALIEYFDAMVGLCSDKKSRKEVCSIFKNVSEHLSVNFECYEDHTSLSVSVHKLSFATEQIKSINVKLSIIEESKFLDAWSLIISSLDYERLNDKDLIILNKIVLYLPQVIYKISSTVDRGEEHSYSMIRFGEIVQAVNNLQFESFSRAYKDIYSKASNFGAEISALQKSLKE